MTIQEIYFCLKLSIIQFLLNKDISFYNKDREIIFGLSTTLNKKMNVENQIYIEEKNNLVLYSAFPIFENFISYNKISSIVNYINSIFGKFSCYVCKSEEDEDINVFCLRNSPSLEKGTVIDTNFWENQVQNQINMISIICDFIFIDFPNSEFYKEECLDNKEDFREFLLSYIQSHFDAINILKDKKEKMDFSSLSEEEIEKEIDKELDNFKDGIKNIAKLNILVAELEKRKAKK